MWRLLIIAAVLISRGTTLAQTFDVFDLDHSQFPIISAKFYAFDADGKQESPNMSEITVTEEGNTRTVLSISCPPFKPFAPVSVAMSIDVSGSMGPPWGGGIAPVELGKLTANALVDRLGLPPSEMALQTCNSWALIARDFTTRRQLLHDAINPVYAGGGNDFVEQLLNPKTGLLHIAKKGKYKRVAVIYTDAWWGALAPDKLKECIDLCKQYEITFFAVIYTSAGAEPYGIKSSLRELTAATGGVFYDGVTSHQAAIDIALRIQVASQSAGPCEIKWQSNGSCTSGNQIPELTWKNQAVKMQYAKPASAIASLAVTPQSLNFVSKPLGTRFDTTIMVTAKQATFNVNTITSSNPKFDIQPQTFVLGAGESKLLTVSFTPTDSSIQWTTFTISTDVCDQSIYAKGIYLNGTAFAEKLQLTQPNGNEEFAGGSDTLITWKNISPGDTVTLRFSSDGGSTWNTVSNTATGGSYRWRVPNIASTRCLISVAQHPGMVGPLVEVEWVQRSIGTGGSAQIGGVAADSLGNVYITGAFQSDIDFDGASLTTSLPSNQHMYIAKFRENGELEWVKETVGINSKGNALACDALGNIYVAGSYNGLTNFGTVTLNSVDTSMFIAKYSPDGNLAWVRDTSIIGEIWAAGITCDAFGNIYATGNFLHSTGAGLIVTKYRSDGIVVWTKSADQVISKGVTTDNSGNVYVAGAFAGIGLFKDTTIKTSTYQLDIFVAKYKSDGTFDWVRTAGGSDHDYGLAIAAVDGESVLVTGGFQSLATFDAKNVTSNGKYDVFVARYDAGGDVTSLTSAGGIDEDFGFSVATDEQSNYFVTGAFGDNITFGNTKLTATAREMYVAKYNSVGSIIWAKQAYGVFDMGLGVATDRFGNAYVGGTFSNDVIIGDSIFLNSNNDDVFLWKIGSPSAMESQADTSDAVFSIVTPLPLSQDIDMGNVLVGDVGDSAVLTFIRNPAAHAVRVDSIVITANEFKLVSGIPPFIIEPNSANHAEFRFTPTSAGARSAQIIIYTSRGQLNHTITGNGIQPEISAISTMIDFGAVETLSAKDSTIAVALTNIGSAPIDFTGDVQLGPDKAQFSLIAGGGAFTLAPNESREVTIRFAPRFIGRTSGRIGFNYNGFGSPAILQLFGQGLGGLVKIADDSAYPGEKRNIAMELLGTPSTSLQSLAAGFRARIAYNSTVLVPFGGNVVRGSGVDTVIVEGNLGTDNTLTSIPFLAGLGNFDVISMDLVEFVWLDAQGQPASYDVETESGTFKVLGVCEEGGKRLFNPEGEVMITRISPNPASESVQVEIETIEAGRTQVVVMDVLGRTVATLYDGEIASGAHKLQLNTSNIAAGSYYLSLVTPTVKRFARVDVVR